jgi:hypothetical protein
MTVNLLVEESGVPGETTDLPQVNDKLYQLKLYTVHHHEQDSKLKL